MAGVSMRIFQTPVANRFQMNKSIQSNTNQYMVIPDPCSSHSPCFSLALLSTALNSAQRRRRIMSNVDKDLDYMISPQEFYTLLSQKFEKDDPKEETRRRTDAYDFAVDFFGN
jgi:hypothetical protein